MIPIVLDSTKANIAVMGEGDRALARLRLLRRHIETPIAVFAPKPSEALAAEAGAALVRRWPDAKDFAGLHVVFAGDLTTDQAMRFAQLAKERKVLFNAEDMTPQCAFHMPATLRRGRLLVTVSTDGAAPALARRLAAYLGQLFGPEWADHVAELGAARKTWRSEGHDGFSISKKTDALIDAKGWLQ